MEFDDLIWLLILLSPLISRLFRKKQPQKAPAPVPQQPKKTGSLEDVLREIREAMEESDRAEAPAPARERPATVERPAPVRPAPARTEGTFLEERFEQWQQPEGPARAEMPRQAERHPKAPRPRTQAAVVQKAPKPSAVPPASRFATPQALREAYVLSLIFGPPRSRRPGVRD